LILLGISGVDRPTIQSGYANIAMFKKLSTQTISKELNNDELKFA
jgi:hypothetical protein